MGDLGTSSISFASGSSFREHRQFGGRFPVQWADDPDANAGDRPPPSEHRRRYSAPAAPHGQLLHLEDLSRMQMHVHKEQRRTVHIDTEVIDR